MNKTALVTGGNSGVGFATAKLLKNRGYEVTICGRNSEKIKKAADDLNVNGITADMSVKSDIQAIIDNFKDQNLNALVNNAGIAHFLPLEFETDENFDDIINTNLRGPLNLIKGLLEPLARAGGSITNVSSAIVNNGKENACFYAASKGGIDAITKNLSIELAIKNIRINAVSLGAIDTPIIHKLGIDEDLIPSLISQQESLVPLKRLGTPNEVAEVIVSQLESTYTTGAIWEIDGGVNAY
jgi:NAD(P)-dependent dehydrogenase (short-subunit alcohol dehydrogenase family)